MPFHWLAGSPPWLTLGPARALTHQFPQHSPLAEKIVRLPGCSLEDLNCLKYPGWLSTTLSHHTSLSWWAQPAQTAELSFEDRSGCSFRRTEPQDRQPETSQYIPPPSSVLKSDQCVGRAGSSLRFSPGLTDGVFMCLPQSPTSSDLLICAQTLSVRQWG